MSIIDAYDPERTAALNPWDIHPKSELKLDACIINFSWKIMNALLEDGLLELAVAGAVRYVSFDCDLYLVRGTRIGVIQTQVGAPFTAGIIEDLSYIYDCEKFLLFGSCGGLDKEQTYGRLIVPTHAYRDEGMSYHYAPAADYIDIKNHDVVSAVLDRLNIPYIKGRSWTTDAFFRETRRNMERRKAEGCIAVDMELSACQAVADYRDRQLYAFLYSADNLDHSQWDPGILSAISLDERLLHFRIALEIAKYVTEDTHE